MAIESLERALDLYGTPIYVYHEIVHNRPVVERFTKRGVVFVDGIDEIPEGATVLYSAHGVAPAIRAASAERRLRAIDATCPLVTKVHLEAVRFAREGYTIFLIGHEGHDEVLGTMGEAPHAIRLVQDASEVERLDLPADAKVAYLTQTTLSVDDAEPPGGGQGAGARGGRGAGAGQSEQLQQHSAGGGVAGAGQAGPPDRRLGGDRPGLAEAGRHGADHGGGQRAGGGGRGVPRLS